MKTSVTTPNLDNITCTIPFRGCQVTVRCVWFYDEGRSTSYHDENLVNRAYFNRYDKFFDDKDKYHAFVKRMLKKSV